MACISLNLPAEITNAQNAVSQATDAFLALSGESCNIFGALGVPELEQGVQTILGAVGGAMGAINSAIEQATQILNSVVDTALGAVSEILNTIKSGIDQVFAFAQDAIGSVTGMIDQAISVLAEKAKVTEILACAGVLGQLGAFPSNVTDKINGINSLLSTGAPVTTIANEMIAGAKDSFMTAANTELNRVMEGIGDKINGSQDLISVNIEALRNFSCAV
jgi:phage-related protein